MSPKVINGSNFPCSSHPVVVQLNIFHSLDRFSYLLGTTFILKRNIFSILTDSKKNNFLRKESKNLSQLMTKTSFQSSTPILSRLKSILAILPKCPNPILGGFSPNRGSNNGSPPPPSLNHKGVTGVHHEGTRDTSGGGGESYDSYDSTGISNRPHQQRKREVRWKISMKR